MGKNRDHKYAESCADYQQKTGLKANPKLAEVVKTYLKKVRQERKRETAKAAAAEETKGESPNGNDSANDIEEAWLSEDDGDVACTWADPSNVPVCIAMPDGAYTFSVKQSKCDDNSDIECPYACISDARGPLRGTYSFKQSLLVAKSQDSHLVYSSDSAMAPGYCFLSDQQQISYALKIEALREERSKVPAARVRSCLCFVPVAFPDGNQRDPRGLMVDVMLFDTCANRVFISYEFYLHMKATGRILAACPYRTKDISCNGTCDGSGKIRGWCMFDIAFQGGRMRVVAEIVNQLGQNMIFGCRYMELMGVSIDFFTSEVHVRSLDFVYETRPEKEELPEVTVGYPLDGSVPSAKIFLTKLYLDRAEALVSEQFTRESVERLKAPSQLDSDLFLKKSYSLMCQVADKAI